MSGKSTSDPMENKVPVPQPFLPDAFAQVLEQISDGFASLDHEWRYTYVNATLAAALKRNPADLIGRRLWEEFPDTAGSAFQQACFRAVAEHVPIEFEHYYEPLGRSFHERVHPTSTGVSLFVRDVTESRQIEDALRASEAQSRRLLRLVPLPLSLIAADGTMRFINDRFVQQFGYSHEEIPTVREWRLKAYPDPAYCEQVVARWTRLVQQAGRMGAQVEPMEVRIVCKDGSTRDAELFAIEMTDGLLTVFVDVTERRRAEAQARSAQAETARLLAMAEQSRRVLLSVIEDQKATQTALRESEERFRSLVETSSHWVWETDSECRYTYAGPQARELLGYPAEEMIGRTRYDYMNEAEASRVRSATLCHFAAHRPLRAFENTCVRRDGRAVVLETSASPIYGPDGKWIGYRGVDRDITEQKALESQLRQGQRMEVIGTLAGGIAHDLNNILAPVLMVAGVLKHKLPDEGDQELVAMMEREVQRGASIIKQLLTFSRGLEGQRTAVQPRHILNDIVLMMQETFPRDIDVEHRFARDIWTVIADPTQLHQVVLNLCVNARDAMPNGGHLGISGANIVLRAGDPALAANAAAGAYVLIEVRDTGHGIDPAIRERIFDPFFTTKPLGKGSGLGLATVLAIVQKHGGFVAVDSAPGRGSVFRVYLPASPDASAVAPAATGPTPGPGRNQLIMVVDDERNVREATRFLLERQGYRVVTAVNGEDALSVYRTHQHQLSLVLTDLMMPVMNGMAFIKALRGVDASIPVIATSGLEEADHRSGLANLGVAELVSKPCQPNVLLDCINRHIRIP